MSITWILAMLWQIIKSSYANHQGMLWVKNKALAIMIPSLYFVNLEEESIGTIILNGAPVS